MRRAHPRGGGREDDCADGGHQQQQRCRLEGDQEALEQQLADRRGRAEAELDRRSLGVDRLQPGAGDRDRQLDEERNAEHRRDEALAGDRLPERLVDVADVGGDEDVEDHHRSGVDHDLGGGQELALQQEEEPGERDQVDDQREDAVEGVAEGDHRDRAAEAADRSQEEADLGHSPSLRSGVRSIGSASSISFVKIRSDRL